MRQINMICTACAIVLCMLLWMGLPLRGQSTLGSIHGAVMDPTGAVLPGAQVTLTNTGTGFTWKTVTKENGVFKFLDLQAGSYSLQVQSPGFSKQKHDGIVLYANQTVTVDSHLTTSSASTTVVVNAAASMIDTQNANLSDALTGKR